MDDSGEDDNRTEEYGDDKVVKVRPNTTITRWKTAQLQPGRTRSASVALTRPVKLVKPKHHSDDDGDANGKGKVSSREFEDVSVKLKAKRESAPCVVVSERKTTRSSSRAIPVRKQRGRTETSSSGKFEFRKSPRMQRAMISTYHSDGEIAEPGIMKKSPRMESLGQAHDYHSDEGSRRRSYSRTNSAPKFSRRSSGTRSPSKSPTLSPTERNKSKSPKMRRSPRVQSQTMAPQTPPQSRRASARTQSFMDMLRMRKAASKEEPSSMLPWLTETSFDVFKVRQIGSGGSGTALWEVEVDGWRCCLKELHLQEASRSTLKETIREIRVMKDLPQTAAEISHVARFIGAQQTADHLMLFMSIYDGSLDSLLGKVKSSNCHLPEIVLAKYAHQLLTGLSVLHNEKLVHRDLKPGNIFYTLVKPREPGISTLAEPTYASLDSGAEEPGEEEPPRVLLPHSLVLGDFGESKKVLPGQLHTSVRGTPSYAAPEMLGPAKAGRLTGEGYSYAVDIWGVGQICTEMMTLATPYADLDFFQAMEAAQRGDLPPIGDSVAARYPGFLSIWCDMLHKEASERPSIDQLLLRLEHLIDPEAAVAAAQKLNLMSDEETPGDIDDQELHDFVFGT